MKVREVIEALQKQNPEQEFVVALDEANLSKVMLEATVQQAKNLPGVQAIQL